MDNRIKIIIIKFNQEEDLKNSILDYFSISLFYLQKLLEKQEKLDNYLNIEINHLVDKEIIKVLNSYIEIPPDIRHSVIRDNKTGTQLLIEQLSSLNSKIQNIWEQSINTNTIVVMHRKITNETAPTETNLDVEPYILDIKKESKEFVQSFDSTFNFESFKKIENSTDKGLTPSKFFIAFILILIILATLESIF